MLHIIKSVQDPLISYVVQDPVRPEIPVSWRVEHNNEVFTLVNEHSEPQAIVCVAYRNSVPSSVDDLFLKEVSEPNTAIFYTIWSYKTGKGQQLLMEAVKGIQKKYPSINRFVTLSPKTDLARKFHLKNGAKELSNNKVTVNYEYRI